MPTNTNPPMRIALVGAGNLATNIGKAFIAAGHDVLQVFSRTEANAATLAKEINAAHTANIAELTDKADVYVFSVKDSALADVVSEAGKGREAKVFLHTAGSVGIDIFRDSVQHYGVLYPMQTFTKSREVDFSKIPVFIEWNDATAEKAIRALADSISEKVTVLSSHDRKYLHLAAVFGCNFVNHCYALAADIMESHGMTFDMLLPLLDETLAKVHSLHPRNAQTGPAVRYDRNVIDRQTAMLEDNPIMKEIYETMSNSIHKKATGQE